MSVSFLQQYSYLLLFTVLTLGKAFVPRSGRVGEIHFSLQRRSKDLSLSTKEDVRTFNTRRTRSSLDQSVETVGVSGINKGSITIESYQHKDWKCTYLYKPPSVGYESSPPLLLIHPVGIGISSWFWKRLMKEFQEDGPAMYAVDLIGCGLEHGADKWDPNEKGLFFPLSWVEGCETLIESVIVPRFYDSKNSGGSSIMTSISGLFSGGSINNNNGTGCIVVAQGGIAPVGLLLASRNPTTVQKLILCSPPIWNDVITPVPQSELERNYNFLRSPIFGPIAFGILESRKAVQFFSDLFLFETTCDDEWLDCAAEGAIKEARPPVEAFNAGLCMSRSLEEEATELIQSTLVVSGESDKRTKNRDGYGTEMRDCVLEKVKSCNVIPWENPEDLKRVIKKFSQK